MGYRLSWLTQTPCRLYRRVSLDAEFTAMKNKSDEQWGLKPSAAALEADGVNSIDGDSEEAVE